jgi:hypothetical protein
MKRRRRSHRKRTRARLMAHARRLKRKVIDNLAALASCIGAAEVQRHRTISNRRPTCQPSMASTFWVFMLSL